MKNPLSEKARVVVYTALITAAVTIIPSLLSFLTGFVQVGKTKEDTKQAAELNDSIRVLNAVITEQNKKVVEFCTIEGEVTKLGGSPVSDVDVYPTAVLNASTPDENGKFIISNMLRTRYRIFLMGPDGKALALLISPKDSPPEKKVGELTFRYNFIAE